MNYSKKLLNRVLSGISILCISGLLLSPSACTSTDEANGPSTRTGAAAELMKISLYMLVPSEMNDARRLSFENFSNGLIAYFYDTDFEQGPNGIVYQRQAKFTALETRRDLIANFENLAVWQLDSTIDLGKRDKSWPKKTLELSLAVNDADLQQAGNSRSWPADQVMLSFLNVALNEANQVGLKKGSLRFVKMAYDQNRKVFNAKIELR